MSAEEVPSAPDEAPALRPEDAPPGTLALLLGVDTTEPMRLVCGAYDLQLFTRHSPLREGNEDAIGVFARGDGLVVAVADGMGGQVSGERASRAALVALGARLAATPPDEEPLRHAVLDGFAEANRAVLDLALGAGTTLTAVLLADDQARCIHVGDSAYVHMGQRGALKAWSVSHSPTGYAVEAGLLAEGEALVHEHRHLVSNHVGSAEMRIDLGAPLPLARRDTLVIASDGLTDNLTTEEVVELARSGPGERAVRALAERAQRRMARADDERPDRPGKPDDLTVVLVRRLA